MMCFKHKKSDVMVILSEIEISLVDHLNVVTVGARRHTTRTEFYMLILANQISSLVGFNNAFDTLRLYKRPIKVAYRQMSCQGITRLNLLSSLDC